MHHISAQRDLGSPRRILRRMFIRVHIPNANAFDQAGALRWYKSDVHAVSEREKRGCALPLQFAKVAAEGASEMRDGKVRLPPE